MSKDDYVTLSVPEFSKCLKCCHIITTIQILKVEEGEGLMEQKWCMKHPVISAMPARKQPFVVIIHQKFLKNTRGYK